MAAETEERSKFVFFVARFPEIIKLVFGNCDKLESCKICDEEIQ